MESPHPSPPPLDTLDHALYHYHSHNPQNYIDADSSQHQLYHSYHPAQNPLDCLITNTIINQHDFDNTYNVFVFGNHNVGKTTLIEKEILRFDAVSDIYQPTGYDVYTHILPLPNNTTVTLKFHDVGGDWDLIRSYDIENTFKQTLLGNIYINNDDDTNSDNLSTILTSNNPHHPNAPPPPPPSLSSSPSLSDTPKQTIIIPSTTITLLCYDVSCHESLLFVNVMRQFIYQWFFEAINEISPAPTDSAQFIAIQRRMPVLLVALKTDLQTKQHYPLPPPSISSSSSPPLLYQPYQQSRSIQSRTISAHSGKKLSLLWNIPYLELSSRSPHTYDPHEFQIYQTHHFHHTNHSFLQYPTPWGNNSGSNSTSLSQQYNNHNPPSSLLNIISDTILQSREYYIMQSKQRINLKNEQFLKGTLTINKVKRKGNTHATSLSGATTAQVNGSKKFMRSLLKKKPRRANRHLNPHSCISSYHDNRSTNNHDSHYYHSNNIDITSEQTHPQQQANQSAFSLTSLTASIVSFLSFKSDTASISLHPEDIYAPAQSHEPSTGYDVLSTIDSDLTVHDDESFYQNLDYDGEISSYYADEADHLDRDILTLDQILCDENGPYYFDAFGYKQYVEDKDMLYLKDHQDKDNAICQIM